MTSAIIPVLIGDDRAAAEMWKALYERGVFLNTAIHPAVPRGQALLRASVMATHERAHLDRALEAFAAARGVVGTVAEIHSEPAELGAA